MSTASHPGPNDTRVIPDKHRARQGQALVEFALVGLILTTMAFGVIEFGRAYYASINVTNAARDAARVAMDPSRSNADIVAAAEAAADPLELSNVDVDRSIVEGETSTITVTYEFETVAPLIANFWGGGALQISESATSRVGWD